jgi:ubiquinone/menaquinone biosynthesis C-methylase UbiE
MLHLLLEIAKLVAIIFGVLLFLFLVVLKIVQRYLPFRTPAFATQLIDNPFRRRFIQKPNIVADRMRLLPGMVVVELGPGKGNYTKVIAERILPYGRVYALDVQEAVVKRLREKVNREKITNIEARIEDAHSFSFPDDSVDRVLAITCLPEIPNPSLVLSECSKILRCNGLVSLCELFFDPHYPKRSTVKKWAQEAGLKLEEEFGNFFSYQLNFKKT